MQEKQKKTGLVWFGNDLRIHDNAVLKRAVHENDRVVGIYCLKPSLLQESSFGFQKLGIYRARFLLESLSDLKQNLLKKNISLIFFLDTAENKIPAVCEELGVHSIYKQREWTHEEYKEKKQVQSKLKNVETIEVYNQFLYHPDDVLSDLQKIPNVFTSFRKKLEKYIKIQPESTTKKIFRKENLVSKETAIPVLVELGFENSEKDSRTAFPFSGGETAVLERLNDYFFKTKNLGSYKKTRNGLLGTDYSSKFSPWLANGSISAKTIYWQVKKFEQEHYKNQSTYWLVFELIWRDYFRYISMKFGNDIFQVGGILKKEYKWNKNLANIKKWIAGETSDDFVNANMIELKRTGWMSNRGRQNVASFFAKELELDWRIGAAYFEEKLIDYDVHSNYGNWMYISGVGNDPRDRKFNTQLQAERYDANQKFRHLWLKSSLF